VPATIKKIAERLHLNPSTVSRALSGSPQISEATRQQVQAVAQELNYSPNLWAQNLVGAGSRLVGCLVRDLANPFYIPMLRAVEDMAEQENYIILLGESRGQIELEKMIVDRYRRIRVAGVIITPVLAELEHLRRLEADGVPVVSAARSVEGLDSINLDNVKSGKLAGEHLLARGYERIGFVQSGDEFNVPEQQRLQGLKMALKDGGLGLCTSYLVGANSIHGGEKAAELWHQDAQKPAAVFCDNDLLAMGFIQHASRMGIRIPQDVAVIGHDDIPFADTFIVPLTTISFPKSELGQQAMQVLMERFNEKGSQHVAKTITLEPHLIERKSC